MAAVLFNSIQFLIFFAVVTPAYFLLPHRLRWALLLAASCWFYMTFIPAYILILLVTISIDYTAGLNIERSRGRRKVLWLVASVAGNGGMLAVFKYWNFIADNSAWIAARIHLPPPFPGSSLILPIGLSFHTFQSLSYILEVYRGVQRAERRFGRLALYVLFYPQLVAGPIERPQNLLHQFNEPHRLEPQRVADGLKLMTWGMFKKVVVADNLARYVNLVYAAPGSYAGPALTLATVMFAFQILYDFSGYTDIARGAARVMGFRLMENFLNPYLASSIGEFWTRWHISLSTWFRDYVYIPLGGNRVPLRRHLGNLLIVFLLSGLWHGASWTFVAWGAFHALLLCQERLVPVPWGRLGESSGAAGLTATIRLVRMGATFACTCAGWIFFRAASMADVGMIAGHLTRGWCLPRNGEALVALAGPGADRREILACVPLLMLAVAGVTAVEAWQQGRELDRWAVPVRGAARWIVYLGLVLAIILFRARPLVPKAFIYFAF